LHSPRSISSAIVRTEYTGLRLNGSAARGQAAAGAGAAHALDSRNFEAEFFGAAEVAIDPTATLEKQLPLSTAESLVYVG
jgi:hypothetical protein